jgi:serine/threonine-protein kinase HipA
MLNVEVLQIYLGSQAVGKLFKFDNGATSPIVRFVADDGFVADPQQATLSISMRPKDPAQQAALWKDVSAEIFNGRDGRLPAFFQNMLPEGVFRTQLAQERGCKIDDHFALFAACGLDLPGAVKALPGHVSRQELARLVTQENDALEMSVTADPLPFGVSISGMQPKVGLIEQGGRYIARKRHGVTRIIGKLPQADRPKLPEVEHLSLSLASAAGANVCSHELMPLEKLDFEHGYTLGGSGHFLAVTRFDRDGAKRIHCEDFAQALNVDPQLKYKGATYAAMAGLMMRYPQTLGLAAVHELLRLITINDMLGNYDAHLKNFCLTYPDGQQPVLSSAFDIVAWSVYISGQGRALAMYRSAHGQPTHALELGPAVIREFCSRVGVAEQPCMKVIKDTAELAMQKWPDMIRSSAILDSQKDKLLAHLQAHRFAKRHQMQASRAAR